MSEPVVDADRLLAWANEAPRRPASIAFTAGPERQAAYWIEWAEARQAADLDRLRAALGAAHCCAPVEGAADGQIEAAILKPNAGIERPAPKAAHSATESPPVRSND